jgi:hypothetical protein
VIGLVLWSLGTGYCALETWIWILVEYLVLSIGSCTMGIVSGLGSGYCALGMGFGSWLGTGMYALGPGPWVLWFGLWAFGLG